VVAHPGETPGTGTYQPVDAPEPVTVKEQGAGQPIALVSRGRQRVIAIEDRWRIDDEWWRTAPISRLYYAVMLNTGQHLVIYKNLVTGGWYRQSY